MLKEYDGIPDVGSRYVLECRCKKIGNDGTEIGSCEDTVNPVSGFIYAENEEQAVNYGMDFIMKYAGDNLLLEDNSILLLDDSRPMDLYYDFSAVEVGYFYIALTALPGRNAASCFCCKSLSTYQNAEPQPAF